MKKRIKVTMFLVVNIFLFSNLLYSQKNKFELVNSFHTNFANQGVAVDQNNIYVINTREIAKYDKHSFKKLSVWKNNNGAIKHLDSGVTLKGKLYCAHSNFPELPMTSSIEIWDTETLEHVGNHSFGIKYGSCTWIDFKDEYWYVAFANYKIFEQKNGKDAHWTLIVKFDQDWNEKEAWVFPEEIIKRFGSMSNSGGSFGPDGLLYCTGHDNPEIYKLKFPKYGSELNLIEIIEINNTGQGIAWDRTVGNENIIYCIDKKSKKINVIKYIR